jgi:predicted nuclease with RNAse H fold
VILDADLRVQGRAWRGNLREVINAADSAEAFVRRLFVLCGAACSNVAIATLAIDAPLGFSEAFVHLVSGRVAVEIPVGNYRDNPYLHRRSERRLFEYGHKPLSPVQDMIGSQATKTMHALAKFAPQMQRCGVWSGGGNLTAIEAYPAPCKKSATVNGLRDRVTGEPMVHPDEHDALTCALIAWLFEHEPDALDPVEDGVPENEGWIWVPRDVLGIQRTALI